MNRKRKLASLLIIAMILSSILASPGYVGASMWRNSSFSEKSYKASSSDANSSGEDSSGENSSDENSDKDLSDEDTSDKDSSDKDSSDKDSPEKDSSTEDSSTEDSSTAQRASDSEADSEEDPEEDLEELPDEPIATPDELIASPPELLMAGDNLKVEIVSPTDTDGTRPGIQTKMQTFVDLNINTQPPDFILGLTVTNSATDLTDTYIEIPLDCVPDGATPPYVDYTMNSPVYTFDEGGSTLANIIEECEITKETLRLHFKVDANQGVHNLFIRFKLNTEYYGNIPPGGTSWIVSPSYYNGVNDVSLGIVEILTTANPTESVSIQRQAPAGSDFGGTSVQMLCTLNNRNPYEAWLKSGSYSYVAVPENFTARGSTTTAGAKTALSALFYEGPTTMMIEGSPYDVYKKYHGNSRETWTNWDHNSIGDTFNRLYLEVSPPADFAVGSQFKVYYGSALTRQNGAEDPDAGNPNVENPLKNTSVTYTKTETLTWVLEGNGYNAHSSGRQASCGIETGNVGKANLNSNWLHAGYNVFNHESSTRNMGMGTAKNVRLEVYSTNEGPARLNYNQVEVSIAAGPYPDRVTGPESGTPCYFKVEFEIENALTGETRNPGISKSGNRTFTVTPNEMPVLGANEFISKVIVTPMGADGNQEGDWSPGNIIGLKYQPKAWPNQLWPDGTPVTKTPTSVMMKWTLYSDNETQPVKDGVSRSIVYLPEQSVSARAQMISTDSQNRGPGDTVTYTLTGYNDLARIDNPWKEPYLIIAVPKVLQLKDPGLPKDYIDLVGNGSKGVMVNKMQRQSSGSADYDFYEILLDDISQKAKRNAPAFEIPMEFEVTDSAPAGTYRIPFVIVSQKDKGSFSQLGFTLNNLGSGIIAPADLGFEAADNYTAIMSGHTNLTLIRKSEISADVNIKTDSIPWSNLDEVSVSPGENVEMMLNLQNTGNVTFNGVKLYNILPYDGDSRGSSGDIVFAGLDGVPSSAEVWYVTAPTENLPSYTAVDLATFNPQQQGQRWSTDVPSDLSTVTAIYIDYGQTRIEPSQALTPTIKFVIPDGTEGSTAYNQFKYIVYDEDTNAVVMHTVGNIKGFSTEGLNLMFVSGVDESITVNNMPANVSKLRESTPEDIDIPTGLINTPIRTGYTFQHWKDDKTGKTYSPGEPVTFNEGVNRITLEAQWKPIKINVRYSANLNSPTQPDPSEQPFAEHTYEYDQTLTEADLPQSNPVREGYQFKGWSTRYGELAAVDFGAGTKIAFTSDTTVYAVWEELCTLTVSQQTAGAFADKTLVFNYTVTFKNADGSAYQGAITYKRSNGDTGEFLLDNDGKGTFSLAEGQNIRFQYFAADDKINYTVLEKIPDTAKNLYQPYVNATIDSDGNVSGGKKTDTAEGIIGKEQTHNDVAYINERTDVPITGITTDNTSNHMMVWLAVLGLLLFSSLYLYSRRKRANRLH